MLAVMHGLLVPRTFGVTIRHTAYLLHQDNGLKYDIFCVPYRILKSALCILTDLYTVRYLYNVYFVPQKRAGMRDKEAFRKKKKLETRFD
jgi:hypothetical protein